MQEWEPSTPLPNSQLILFMLSLVESRNGIALISAIKLLKARDRGLSQAVKVSHLIFPEK